MRAFMSENNMATVNEIVTYSEKKKKEIRDILTMIRKEEEACMLADWIGKKRKKVFVQRNRMAFFLKLGGIYSYADYSLEVMRRGKTLYTLILQNLTYKGERSKTHAVFRMYKNKSMLLRYPYETTSTFNTMINAMSLVLDGDDRQNMYNTEHKFLLMFPDAEWTSSIDFMNIMVKYSGDEGIALELRELWDDEML